MTEHAFEREYPPYPSLQPNFRLLGRRRVSSIQPDRLNHDDEFLVFRQALRLTPPPRFRSNFCPEHAPWLSGHGPQLWEPVESCIACLHCIGSMQALLLILLMTDVVHPRPITFRTLTTPGIAAVKKYWKPFILLQSLAFFLVLAYYTSDHVRQTCGSISQFKVQGGFVFSAITAAIAGGLLPEVAKAIMLGDRAVDRKRLGNIIFAVLGFAGNGIITDLQYRGLAWVFGNDNHLATILKKIVVDQFICTPGYSVPYWMLLYLWRVNDYNFLSTAREITPRWFVSRLLPLIIPAWCFWIPMVTLIYALPSTLQYCLYLCALAGWSLIMVFVASQEELEDSTEPPATPATPAA